MSHAAQLLAHSSNGRLLTCGCCDALHLEFGNLCWRFEPEGFMRFQALINGLDVEGFLRAEPGRDASDRLRIALPPTNLALALTVSEIEELRLLLEMGQAVVEEAEKEDSDVAGLCEEIEAWLNQPWA